MGAGKQTPRLLIFQLHRLGVLPSARREGLSFHLNEFTLRFQQGFQEFVVEVSVADSYNASQSTVSEKTLLIHLRYCRL